MTPEQLISEGRALARPTVLLRPEGNGPVAAYWHPRDNAEIDATGFRGWMTIDTQFIPGEKNFPQQFMTVFTDERNFSQGRLDFRSEPPRRSSVKLRAFEEPILPPIEAVFLKGSDDIGRWLASNDWPRDERYNNNFGDAALVQAYERVWFKEYPTFRQDGTHAALGGWHWPCADDDWYELATERLLALTVMDSEPWVETWQSGTKTRIIQRIT